MNSQKQKLVRSGVGALLLGVLLSGCVTTPTTQYNWGTYQDQVYARFKGTTTPLQQIKELEKVVQTSTPSWPAAPGIRAHLGLLYGEVGRVAEMREQFLLEKQTYPESAVFMDFLLSKSNKMQGSN